MRVLVFARQELHALPSVISAAADLAWVRVARTEPGFEKALLRCLNGETLIVFFVQAREDMGFLAQKAKGFMDMKLVICLENESQALYDQAFDFYPRLVVRTCDNPCLLPAVVKGLLSNLAATLTR